MTVEPDVAPRTGTHSTELRSRILREATKLFANKGYAATSVREVVEASGCTKPALYYYFKSKDALFLEAIRAETAATTRILEQSMPHGGGAMRDFMTRGLEAYLEHVHSNPMGMRLLLRAELQRDEGQPIFDFDSLRTLHLQMLLQVLSYGVTTREVRSDVNLEDAAFALAGMVEQRMQLWLAGVPFPPDLPDRVLGLLFHGVAPR